MFGHNQIVGEKYFADAGDKLLVTSLFMTLQGEGPLAGLPAFFVRLSKCSLSCGFCDTYFEDGDWYTINELLDEIDSRINQYFAGDVPAWARYDLNHPFVPRRMACIITGGEPMLQKNIVPFCKAAVSQFSEVQIESNGIVIQPVDSKVIMVCSPKCAERDGKPVRYLKPSDKMLERADCLKFILTADEQSPYHTIPDWAFEWQDEMQPIYISPMAPYLREPELATKLQERNVGTGPHIDLRSTVGEKISAWEPGLLDMDQLRRNYEYAAQYCIRHGLIYSPQSHLFANLP